MRTLKKTFILSPQQIVSCDKVDLGCNGGNTETAYQVFVQAVDSFYAARSSITRYPRRPLTFCIFQYVEKAGGIVLASAYPYTSKGGNTGMLAFLLFGLLFPTYPPLALSKTIAAVGAGVLIARDVQKCEAQAEEGHC